MTQVFFVTDLHGHRDKYIKLFGRIRENPPEVVFVGGDLLPPFYRALSGTSFGNEDFIHDFLALELLSLKKDLGSRYPRFFLIMGNDDPRCFESSLISAGAGDLWIYLHNRKFPWRDYFFYGYNYVPPTPFLLKDWERYDVSRYADVGCADLEEGRRTFPVNPDEILWSTIRDDLAALTDGEDLSRSVFLFHTPPYNSLLDKGDVAGKMVDHVPLDEHLGSIAVERFIQERQPLLTLHGHVHESARLTGRWMEKRGNTVCINGAHDGGELCLVSLDLENPHGAERILL